MKIRFPEPKTALITGAAKRIGRSIAFELSDAGWSVAIHHRSSEMEAEDTVSSILSKGGNAVAIAAELSNEEETLGLIAQTKSLLGPIGCLVNNASIFEYDSIDSVSLQSWNDHMAINLRAPFLLSQSMSASLPEGYHGVIINILDQRVWNLTPHFISYTLSKSGLWTLTQTLALALAPNIRVNAIGPGPVLPSIRQTESQFFDQCKNTPLQQGAKPEEIALAVRFIVMASSMTGQMIALDGGQHLGWSLPKGSEFEE